MKSYRPSVYRPEGSDVDAALEAMDAGSLRELIRDLLPSLDDKTYARAAGEIIDRAVRGTSEWTPDAPSRELVTEVLEFAQAAGRVGYANPIEVDDYLRQGMNAFLAKDYRSALEIFRALLIPVSRCDIDLGQHEQIEEVLGVDPAECAAQYVVATYMTATPEERPESVRNAVDEMRFVGYFWNLLEQIERTAVEPLPDFEDFLRGLNDLVRKLSAGERHSGGDRYLDRWLREVTKRLEGTAGLAALARSTGRAADFDAWCRALIDVRDWQAALAAYDEAAETVSDETYVKARYLDGAALAAQELDRNDLPERLERAWRTAPSLPRLRRRLGSADCKATLKTRVAAAIESCPKEEARQLAFLHLLNGDTVSAAGLLAGAPGLGWSRTEHPGHLLFRLFIRLLGGTVENFDSGCLDRGEFDFYDENREEPHLRTPSIEDILELAGIREIGDTAAREAALDAMRKAAEKRLEGVTGNKRRGNYGHAAELTTACAALDPSGVSRRWLADIRGEYRRYPALQREFERLRGR